VRIIVKLKRDVTFVIHVMTSGFFQRIIRDLSSTQVHIDTWSSWLKWSWCCDWYRRVLLLLVRRCARFLIIHERIAELCRVRPSPWAVWPATFSAELAGVGTHRRLAVHRFLTQCLRLQLSRSVAAPRRIPSRPAWQSTHLCCCLSSPARITAASCQCNRSIQYSKEKRRCSTDGFTVAYDFRLQLVTKAAID